MSRLSAIDTELQKCARELQTLVKPTLLKAEQPPNALDFPAVPTKTAPKPKKLTEEEEELLRKCKEFELKSMQCEVTALPYAEVCQRFTHRSVNLPTNLWVDGVINPGSRADVNLAILTTLFDNLKIYPEYRLHLLGQSKTRQHVNPKWVKKYGDAFQARGGEIYKAHQQRTDITIHVNNTEGRIVLYGMKFTLSNFVLYSKPVHLQDDLNMTFPKTNDYMRNRVIDILLTASINTTEKLIQLPKNLAAVMPHFSKAEGDSDTIDANLDLLRKAAIEQVPKEQKRFGQLAQVNGNYFVMANGATIDIHNVTDWSQIGTNILIQAFGAMLRLLTGDTMLSELLETCLKYHITVIEAAVHGDADDTYGASPDLTWGGCCIYPWMSPDCNSFEWGLDNTGHKISGLNHLGLGYKLLMQAMEHSNSQMNINARRALGLPEEYQREPLFPSGNFQDKCRLVGQHVFGQMLLRGF